jgi:hypothetical protein
MAACSLPPHTPMTCFCKLIFHIEQFGGILPQFVFPSIPWLYSGPSSSETSFQCLFWDSSALHSYYMPRKSCYLSYRKLDGPQTRLGHGSDKKNCAAAVRNEILII